MFKKLKQLSDTVVRKFVEVLDVSNWQIQSDTGWTDIKTVNKTVEYEVYKIVLYSGNTIYCADNHIFIDEKYQQVFAKDSWGKILKVNYGDGTDKVVKVIKQNKKENMYDFTLADQSNKLYYANGVLSHNTTLMTIYALWLGIFYSDQLVVICANKSSTAQEIFARIRLAYLELPNWLKTSALEFNKTSMILANGSKIVSSATTDSAIRGNTVSCLILDEFAFVEPGIAEEFWTSVTPTLVTNPDAKLFISSTPNGVGNMFHNLYERAINGKSEFKVRKVTWQDVPGRTSMWRKRIIETEFSGDEEKFEQEYNCKFLGASASPFGDNIFDSIKKDIKDPEDTLDDGKLKIWEYPKNERVYSIGVDVGEGLGQDSSVIQVFDLTDLNNIQQVATYKDNTINTTDFAEKVYEISSMYGFPVLSIERNGCGSTVCDRLWADKSYQHLVNFGASKTGLKNFRPGIISGTNVKSPAITNWRYWVCDTLKCRIHDEDFLNEIRHFEKKQGSSWGAQKGYHDDLIMATVWALNVLHRDVVNDHFYVNKFDAKGKPSVISNKFDYNISSGTVKDSFLNKYTEWGRVPVMLHGSAGSSQLISPTRFNNRDPFASSDYDSLLSDGWVDARSYFGR